MPPYFYNSVRALYILVVVVACLLGPAATLADAQSTPRHHRHHRMLTDPELDAALVVDAKSGNVLYSRNAESPRHPASLTKMMTLYLLFEKLHQKKIALATLLPVSASAAAQPRSHLRLREGDMISVETAIKAIVVCSANDAAVAVSENLGGTESHFAELMNAKARQLGMTHTFYHNSTGLPDDLQQTTAQDLVILARHLVFDFPEYFPYFRTRQLAWRGISYDTHDNLIGNYQGADGIKTGYIDASGYNLVSTAERDGTRLIAVVMGGLTAARRDEAMVDLLDASFAAEKAKDQHLGGMASDRAKNSLTGAASP
ncbi:MAG: D-alanyl-D-alanine carboxypeptidase [Proteobacteria bacterium]|nr:D-alanyl-D-alanine carboxypeptidase [Pseudomonadota bacterium]